VLREAVDGVVCEKRIERKRGSEGGEEEGGREGVKEKRSVGGRGAKE